MKKINQVVLREKMLELLQGKPVSSQKEALGVFDAALQTMDQAAVRHPTDTNMVNPTKLRKLFEAEMADAQMYPCEPDMVECCLDNASLEL